MRLFMFLNNKKGLIYKLILNLLDNRSEQNSLLPINQSRTRMEVLFSLSLTKLLCPSQPRPLLSL